MRRSMCQPAVDLIHRKRLRIEIVAQPTQHLVVLVVLRVADGTQQVVESRHAAAPVVQGLGRGAQRNSRHGRSVYDAGPVVPLAAFHAGDSAAPGVPGPRQC